MTTKQFSLMDLFSIVDGRLSMSGMQPIYEFFEFYYNMPGIMTHHLPVAMDYLRNNKPDWFIQIENVLQPIIDEYNDDFKLIMDKINQSNTMYNVTALPESKLPEFWAYFSENHLLKNK